MPAQMCVALVCLMDCVSEVCVIFILELKGLAINPIGKKSKGRLEFAVAPSESLTGQKKRKLYVELKWCFNEELCVSNLRQTKLALATLKRCSKGVTFFSPIKDRKK